jgi:hypothetical protein
MSVRRVTINGSTKVWMARISYHGVCRSRVCATKEELGYAVYARIPAAADRQKKITRLLEGDA